MLSIIIGSNRKDSQSIKVAKYIKNEIDKKQDFDRVHLIDLHDLNLPLWNEENFLNHDQWNSTSQKLKDSSSFIVLTPEWDGMATPAIKNFFNYCRHQELFHKPALLISISAGFGGSYPIAELRMSSYKNSRICYLPEHVIIRQVEEVLNNEYTTEKAGNDFLIRKRLKYALQTLFAYTDAFKLISKQQFLFNPTFQNGM